MSDDKLGPKPDAEIEPPPENPGGADAINDDTPFSGDEDMLARDLHPDRNPGVEDHVPEEIGMLDDKTQEGTSDGAPDDAEKDEPA